MNFGVPSDRQQIQAGENVNPDWYKLFNNLRNWVVGNSQSGPTTNRPTKNLEIGQTYYDTTLGYRIDLHSVNPIVWHNGVGATV